MDIEPSYISSSSHSIYSQNSQNNSFKLQHQNSFPPHQQYYGQHPMYPPNMYYGQPMYPPPQMYPPPPPPQQPQGMFGNFIMNQISKHMYEKGGSDKNLPPNNSPWAWSQYVCMISSTTFIPLSDNFSINHFIFFVYQRTVKILNLLSLYYLGLVTYAFSEDAFTSTVNVKAKSYYELSLCMIKQIASW